MSDEKSVNDAINESLLQDVDRLTDERDKLRELIGRPITLNVQSDTEILRSIKEYLPQLTHQATNFAVAASATKEVVATLAKTNEILTRIAMAMEELTRIAMAMEEMTDQ